MAHVVNGSRVDIANSVDEQNVSIQDRTVKTAPDKFSFSFEPHSFTQIVIKTAK